MKTVKYAVLVMGALAMPLLNACPFTFINDGDKDVLIVDTVKNEKFYAAAGKTIKVPGLSVENEKVWVYVRKSGMNFSPEYAIEEVECMPEGHVLNIRWSQLQDRARSFDTIEGTQIHAFSAMNYPHIERTIRYSPLRRESV